MNHVRGHQDKRVRTDKLTLIERLNIKADHVIGSNASVSKKIHINNTPFVVYVDNNFIPNNFAQEITKIAGKKKQQHI